MEPYIWTVYSTNVKTFRLNYIVGDGENLYLGIALQEYSYAHSNHKNSHPKYRTTLTGTTVTEAEVGTSTIIHIYKVW